MIDVPVLLAKGIVKTDWFYLLQDLPQIREEIYNERYGDEPS